MSEYCGPPAVRLGWLSCPPSPSLSVSHLDLVLAVLGAGDAHGALLHEVHAVGVVALLDDELAVSEGARHQRVRQVHPLVRLSAETRTTIRRAPEQHPRKQPETHTRHQVSPVTPC